MAISREERQYGKYYQWRWPAEQALRPKLQAVFADTPDIDWKFVAQTDALLMLALGV